MSERLCRDCMWCEPAKGYGLFSRLKWEYAKCGRTAEIVSADPSPVDGRRNYVDHRYLKMCENERSSERNGRCGPQAKHFEPKP